MGSVSLPAPPQYSGEQNIDDWLTWSQRFTHFLTGSGITDEKQKKSLLLFLVGPKVNDIYKLSANDADNYDAVVTNITNYLTPKKNLAFERYMFKKMERNHDEQIADYILRLRKVSTKCGFDNYNEEHALADQIIQSCGSDDLRKILLKESVGKVLSVEEITQSIILHETAAKQSNMMQSPDSSSTSDFDSTNALWSKKSTRFQKPQYHNARRNVETDRESCRFCGLDKHENVSQCPARGTKFKPNTAKQQNQPCAYCGFARVHHH